ncbi:hypothetical protein INT44_004259 [Umbelopsis vinacea]|uniref:Uncharacterized protein n=1 Tax=Umbelopsis vinacea TaxID=44442 RepID=A0A8H7QAU7_9FUNG|nr:hypothetical protein INT44_004259 [Umbelopsis vinacea]
MKFSIAATFALGFLAVTAPFVSADSLSDEIDAATKKFCGGLALTAPTKSQTFTEGSKIKLTVTRKPNSESKVINAVDIYHIGSGNKLTYLGTTWTGKYKLNSKATISVDISKKAKNIKLPAQFEFRTWVHNNAGPDCTLMSKVFKVVPKSHKNDDGTDSIEDDGSSLDPNVDNGCFGVSVNKPASGENVKAGEAYTVSLTRDSASHVEDFKSIELYKIDMQTKESTKVKDSWTGNEHVRAIFNVKDTLPASDVSKQYAYYYKVTADTQHNETCSFHGHAFYVSN